MCRSPARTATSFWLVVPPSAECGRREPATVWNAWPPSAGQAILWGSLLRWIARPEHTAGKKAANDVGRARPTGRAVSWAVRRTGAPWNGWRGASTGQQSGCPFAARNRRPGGLSLCLGPVAPARWKATGESGSTLWGRQRALRPAAACACYRSVGGPLRDRPTPNSTTIPPPFLPRRWDEACRPFQRRCVIFCPSEGTAPFGHYLAGAGTPPALSICWP